MKKEFEIVDMIELSSNEIIFINGGGSAWNFLGEVLGYVGTFANAIYDLPFNIGVEYIRLEGEAQQMIDTFNRR
jgi:hypothetical protein